MNPKPDPKTYLTLSAGHELGRGPACRPDEFPPYERGTRRRVRVFVAVATVAALFAAGSVQAASPGDRCSACQIQPARTPHPTPFVVGLPVVGTGSPSALPDTDTAP